MMKTLLVFSLTLTVTLAADLPFKRIDEITGLTGKWNQEEAVYKVTSPRNDVTVRVDGWQMPPFMGLTSWAAFTPGKQQEVMVMGDLVLLQDEVNPVMSAAFGNDLDVTALHNHFFFDEPKVYFMHIAGEGSAEKLATGVKAALDTVKRIRSEKPEPSRSFGGMPPSKNSISPDAIAAALGVKGEAKDGMFKAVIGRTTTMDCGCKVGKEMGVNTWAAFAGTDDNAIVDGDFAVLETELQPVLRSLRNDHINIVAIHHHMSKEEPRILFLHYWGRGPAKNLAESVKRALQVQKGVAFNASPADFERAQKGGATVVDVCTPKEFAEGHIPGAINLDVNAADFARKAGDLDKSQSILVNCHAGIRGARAAAILHELGFKSVMNLEGGQIAWKADGRNPQVGSSKVQQTGGESAVQ